MNLGAIRDSFLNRSFDMESIALWLAAIAIVVAVILIIFIIRTLRAKRVRYNPMGSIADAETIRMFIRQGFEQRRPFELQLHSTGAKRPSLRTSPEYLGLNSLTVEANGIEHLSDDWIGREVDIFFRVNIDGDFIYYTFQSKIDGIHFPMKGLCHITITIPELLENRQKRAFLRIRPPDEFFKGSAIWHGLSLPEGETLADLGKWNRPGLLLLPRRLEQFQILNISAGGMRLRVPHAVVREKDIRINSVEQIIIMLDLLEPEPNKLLRFWIQCRIQSVWFEHPSRDLYVGIQFMAWGRPREYPGGGAHSEIEWLRLPHSNEVEPIGNWIMRRHMELFREVPGEIN
jgi:hypothetical protein